MCSSAWPATLCEAPFPELAGVGYSRRWLHHQVSPSCVFKWAMSVQGLLFLNSAILMRFLWWFEWSTIQMGAQNSAFLPRPVFLTATNRPRAKALLKADLRRASVRVAHKIAHDFPTACCDLCQPLCINKVVKGLRSIFPISPL